MKSNNPAEWHNVKHFSASQCNSFIHSHALWLAQIAGMKSKVGPAAFRGTAVGIAAAWLGEGKGGADSALAAAEQSYFKELHKSGISKDSPAAIKEYNLIVNTVQMLRTGWTDKVIESERRIEFMLGDIPIPFIGYVDMICDNKLIELKSKAVTTNKLDAAANMQAALYQEATGLEAEVYYTGPKGITIFKVDHAAGIRRAKQAANAMLNILSLSNDINEIIRLYFRPDPDDWRIGEHEMQFFNSILGE